MPTHTCGLAVQALLHYLECVQPGHERHLGGPWGAIVARAELPCTLQVPVAQHVSVAHQEYMTLGGDARWGLLQAEDDIRALTGALEVVRATVTSCGCSIHDSLCGGSLVCVCVANRCQEGRVPGAAGEEVEEVAEALAHGAWCLIAHEYLEAMCRGVQAARIGADARQPASHAAREIVTKCRAYLSAAFLIPNHGCEVCVPGADGPSIAGSAESMLQPMQQASVPPGRETYRYPSTRKWMMYSSPCAEGDQGRCCSTCWTDVVQSTASEAYGTRYHVGDRDI